MFVRQRRLFALDERVHGTHGTRGVQKAQAAERLKAARLQRRAKPGGECSPCTGSAGGGVRRWMPPAALAGAPDAVMLADARAPAALAVAPLAVYAAVARAPAVLAVAPPAVMLADARAPAAIAVECSGHADARTAALAVAVAPRGYAGRCSRPRSTCSCSRSARGHPQACAPTCPAPAPRILRNVC